jgi:hypothetical protein
MKNKVFLKNNNNKKLAPKIAKKIKFENKKQLVSEKVITSKKEIILEPKTNDAQDFQLRRTKRNVTRQRNRIGSNANYLDTKVTNKYVLPTNNSSSVKPDLDIEKSSELSLSTAISLGWSTYPEFQPAIRIGNSNNGKRVNLTKLFTLTIDSASSMDLDDALSIELLPKGLIKLYVHISDVAEMIAPSSYLDKEAEKRTTSLYLPNLVLPMLPFSLSHDLLSLLPGEQRNALTLELLVDGEGKVIKKSLYQSTIKSNLRLDYSEVASILLNETKGLAIPIKHLERTITTIKALHLLGNRISQQRIIRGGLNLEQFFENNSNDQKEYNPVGHEIIERLMVLANEQVALWLEERKSRVVYRVHPTFTREEILSLTSLAKEEGLLIHLPEKITPIVFASLLSQIKGHKSERKIIKFIQKKLSTAYYASEPSEHFGLGSDAYLHFTSPIRRYSDLMNHRFIKQKLNAPRINNQKQGNYNVHLLDKNIKAKVEHLNHQAKLAYQIEQKSNIANQLSKIIIPKGAFHATFVYSNDKGDYYKTDFSKVYALLEKPTKNKFKKNSSRTNPKNRFLIKDINPLSNIFIIEKYNGNKI